MIWCNIIRASFAVGNIWSLWYGSRLCQGWTTIRQSCHVGCFGPCLTSNIGGNLVEEFSFSFSFFFGLMHSQHFLCLGEERLSGSYLPFLLFEGWSDMAR
jgi:hypothetical protein